MKRLAAGVVIGVLATALSAPADQPPTQPNETVPAAKEALRDYFTPLLSPPRRATGWHLHDCDARHCKFQARGRHIRCAGTVQVRPQRTTNAIWFSRLRCR